MKDNIPDNFVDLTVTSPPYDDLRKYNGFVFDYKSMISQLYRITKDGGIVVWVVGDKTEKGSETGTSFKQALYFKELGFNLHDTMIYAKENILPMDPRNKRYYQGFEYIFIFSKGKVNTCNYIYEDCKHAGKNGKPYSRNSDGTLRLDRKEKNENHIIKDKKIHSNIWYYSNVERTGHPAPFPSQLARDNISSWTNENDIVFDPMCGGGTTCKEAYLLHRNFIGVDISKEYINNICIPRLEQCGWNNQ